jgi:hypothetical protein
MAREYRVRQLWLIWLNTACSLVVLLSLILVLFPTTGQFAFNKIFFGNWLAPLEFSFEAVRYVTFVYGVLGAVMIGWMITLLGIINGPFASGHRWAFLSIAFSVGTWFFLDSSFSCLAGFPANIGLNAIFSLSFVIPLVGSYRTFWPRKKN